MTLALAAFILSFSIGLPIWIRAFYAWQVDVLKLTEVKVTVDGVKRLLTREEILTAYNEVLDFCLGKSDSFSAGILNFSEEGASHFADCRGLFLLDIWVCVISAAVLAVGGGLAWREKKMSSSAEAVAQSGKAAAYSEETAPNVGESAPRKTGRHTFLFWGPMLLLIVFTILGVWGALDFDGLFTGFHQVFFPGKTNWLFDPATDPIICLMPQEFFMNCAILIAGAIVALSACCLVADHRARRK